MNLQALPCSTNLFTKRTLVRESVGKMFGLYVKNNICFCWMAVFKTKTAGIFSIIISCYKIFKILWTTDVLN